MALMSRNFTDLRYARFQPHTPPRPTQHPLPHTHRSAGAGACRDVAFVWRSSQRGYGQRRSRADTPPCPSTQAPPPNHHKHQEHNKPFLLPSEHVTALAAGGSFVAAQILNPPLPPSPFHGHVLQIQRLPSCCSRPLGARGRRSTRP